MQPAPNFNLQQYLKGISSPDDQIAYSPQAANGTPANAPSTMTPKPFYLPMDQAGGFGNWLGGNAPLFGNIMDFVGKGVQAYAGLKSLSLASDALKLEKERFRTNLANQTSSYNTQMRDRITGRSYATEEERKAALDAALLPSTPGRGG
jgi:hypothetical protein